MATHRCLRCNGTKKIAPMGGIIKDCDVCKGRGYVVSIEATKTQERRLESQGVTHNEADNDLVVVKKKPGRKKGWNLPKPDTLQVSHETVNITE